MGNQAFSQQEKLEILFSQEVRYDKVGKQEINIYWGDVQVKKGKTYMYMDSVRQIERDLWAYGDIIIQESDSVTLFGDWMYFDDKNDRLYLHGDVVMQSKEEALFTNYLEYNLKDKVGYYTGGGTLTNNETFLSSKIGTYYTRSEDMLFKDSVFVENPEFKLKADSLWFNQETRIITFTGPTLIQFENSSIYCEGGYYDIPGKKALFTKNAQYTGEKSIATGDSILYLQDQGRIEISGNSYYREDSLQARAKKMIYFEEQQMVQLIKEADFKSVDLSAKGDFLQYFTKTKNFKTNQRTTIVQDKKAITADNFDVDNISGKGYISGNVFFSDTLNKIALWSNSSYIDRQNNYIKNFGNRPLLLNYAGGDSLWICADTLISFTGDHRKYKLVVFEPDSSIVEMTIDSSENNLSMSDSILKQVIAKDSIQSNSKTTQQNLKKDTLKIADKNIKPSQISPPKIDSIGLKKDTTFIKPQKPENLEFTPITDKEKDREFDLEFDSLKNNVAVDSLMLDSLTQDSIAEDTSNVVDAKETRVIFGIGDVRIFREGMQGVCDSLTYLELDSTFYLDGTPILWSDSTQISGDSIHLILVNNKIDRLLAINNAFIVTTIDGYFFSQIAGKRAEGFFEDNSMKEMLVRGAVRTVYYIINDDDEYVGVNKQDASRLKIIFEEGKPEDIFFYEKPEGEMLPMRGTNHEGLKLEGFFFAIDRRPTSPEDLRPGFTDGVREFITLGHLSKPVEEDLPSEPIELEEEENSEETLEEAELPAIENK